MTPGNGVPGKRETPEGTRSLDVPTHINTGQITRCSNSFERNHYSPFGPPHRVSVRGRNVAAASQPTHTASRERFAKTRRHSMRARTKSRASTVRRPWTSEVSSSKCSSSTPRPASHGRRPGSSTATAAGNARRADQRAPVVRQTRTRNDWARSRHPRARVPLHALRGLMALGRRSPVPRGRADRGVRWSSRRSGPV
jgi:hypothetical protein